MASVRPAVGVYGLEGGVVGSVKMPGVFGSGLRADVVRTVSASLSRNRRQAYGVRRGAGYETSAESWGTGRAVARIPRVPGGGTHRSGQAAFGNMCRGGGMFAPTKTYRRWHRRVNVALKRQSVAAALAACAVPSLVAARGHRVDALPELPLVLCAQAEELQKSKEALRTLEALGLRAELLAVRQSRRLRAGKGKGRNRRTICKRGPLVVYAQDRGICRAFRNLPGVDLCQVDRLSVLTLAPGGTLGRLCVFTATAFQRLHLLFGSLLPSAAAAHAPLKKRFALPRPLLANADIARIVNSPEVQAALRPARKAPPKRKQHKNLLSNRAVLLRVNPAAKNLKRNAALAQTKGSKLRGLLDKRKLAARLMRRAHRAASKNHMRKLDAAFADAAAANLANAKQTPQQLQ